MKFAIAATLAAATLVSAPSLGRTPEFRVPDFSHLRARAAETVDIDVGGFLLGLVRWAAKNDQDSDPHLRLLEDIKSVRVRSYKFDNDGEYSRDDVDQVRKQLRSPAWNAMVQVHKREAKEDVDVFLCVEDNKTCGLAVIATQPREFTVVSIEGDIDIDKLAQLEGEFGIPKISDQPEKD